MGSGDAMRPRARGYRTPSASRGALRRGGNPRRRVALHVIICSLTLVLFTVSTRVDRALAATAISYPRGWNLVSGPAGSRLVGASGFIYTQQAGDAGYEVLPATSQLGAGWGYWAYFADGGSLQAGADSNTYQISLTPGQAVMLGNPSATEPAVVSGAAAVNIYVPGQGYRSVQAIPPGAGAWVTSAGSPQSGLAVSVAVTVDPDPLPAAAPAAAPALAATAPPPAPTAPPPAPTAPPPAATAPPDTTTYDGLRAAALTSADLDGFSLEDERPLGAGVAGVLAAYEAIWSKVSGPMVTTLNESLTRADSLASALRLDSNAALAVAGPDGGNFNVRTLPVDRLGTQAQAFSYNWIGSDTGKLYEGYSLVFQRGLVIVALDLYDDPGLGSIDTLVAYARVIDARLIASTAARSR